MTEHNNEDDLFDKLIHYSDEDSLQLVEKLQPIKFTFLEPNIDIVTNFSLKLPQTIKSCKLPAFSDTK